MNLTKKISRRRFGDRLVRGIAVVASTEGLWSQERAGKAQREPEIRSFDLSLLDDWHTPNELFFVREHFPRPALSEKEWMLSVDGAVRTPFEISYDEILNVSRMDLAVTLECAGNPVGGGLISNARWTGVGLSWLLGKAQPLAEARSVRMWGADQDPKHGNRYYRSISLAKALHKDVLLAYRMNGHVLPRDHGFPLRAVIPGWYGMDSVKWVQRVEVLRGEDTTPFMREAYARRVRSGSGEGRIVGPVTAIQIKSAFSRPLDGAVLVGKGIIVQGAAWAGERRVEKVEVSLDAGKTWQPAQLLETGGHGPRSYAWAFWNLPWQFPSRGKHELVVRATDDLGRTQPAERPVDRLDPNELNHYQRVRCLVV